MREFDDAPFRPGDLILGRYEVKYLLGRGGHAFVFYCHDHVLEEDVAVKVIPNPPDKDRDLLERALKEARFLYRLNHINVVRVLAADLIAGRMVCIVMELLRGLSLRQMLAVFGSLGTIEALMIVRQIAAGAAAAHAKDAIHRDIKPDNVLVLPPKNLVKLVDFGIAKFLAYGVETGDRTRFHGTPRYMSPEHLKGETVTPLSDMYQIGTVLFEMIVGVPPVLVGVEEENFTQVAYAQISCPTPRLQALVPSAPPELDYLIQTSTAKDPTRRFESMEVFLIAIDTALRDCLARLPVEARRIRYVDENVIRIAKALVSNLGSDALLNRPRSGPTPLPLIDARAQPFEIWDTDMVSNPGFAEGTPAPELPQVGSDLGDQPPSIDVEQLAAQLAANTTLDLDRVPMHVAAAPPPPTHDQERAPSNAVLHVAPVPLAPREQRIRSDTIAGRASVEIGERSEGTRTPGTPPSVYRTVPELSASSAALSSSPSSWKRLLLAAAGVGAIVGTGVLAAPALQSLPSPSASVGAEPVVSSASLLAPEAPAHQPLAVDPLPAASTEAVADAPPAYGAAAVIAPIVEERAPVSRASSKRPKKKSVPTTPSSQPRPDTDRVRENLREYLDDTERRRKELWIRPR